MDKEDFEIAAVYYNQISDIKRQINILESAIGDLQNDAENIKLVAVIGLIRPQGTHGTNSTERTTQYNVDPANLAACLTVELNQRKRELAEAQYKFDAT